MKIIFMGSPEFATPTLTQLIESHHDILSVYSQPPRPSGRGHKVNPTPVHKLAAENGLNVLTPEKLTEDEVQKILDQNPDLIVVVAYGLLLPKKLVETIACINLHPSALPKWRGAAPMNYPILNGEKGTDICIMKMEKGLDSGPVYLRKSYEIGADETAGQLHDRFKEEGADLMLSVINQWDAFKDAAVEQAGESTYAHKFKTENLPALRKIEFAKPADEIHNQIRGLSPWPGAVFEHNGNEIKVLESTLSKKAELNGISLEKTAKICEIVKIDNETLWVQAKNDIVGLKMLQRSGKRAMPVREFLKGYPLQVGEVLY